MHWIKKVLKYYSLGSSLRMASGGGTANLNLILRTETGTFFLKRRRPEYASRNRIIFEDAFQRHLQQRGLPVFPPLRAANGEVFVALEDGVFQLYPHIKGQIFLGRDLNEVREAGKILGLFHQGARSFVPPTAKKLPRYDDPEVMRENLEKVKIRARSKEKEEIRGLINLSLEIERQLSDRSYCLIPSTYIHGDFHPVNLKSEQGKIIGIFDFDWVSLQPQLRDVADGLLFVASVRETDYRSSDIVSLTQAVHFDLKKTEAFLQSYEGTTELSSEERRLIPWFIKARWLNCRIEGMRKITEGQRISYLLQDINETLDSLEEIESKL